MENITRKYKAINPIPEGISIHSEIELTLTDGIGEYGLPPVYAQAIGEDSAEFGHRSYIVADKKADNTVQFDKLIKLGLLRSFTRSIMRDIEGEYVHAELTTYYFMYKDENAACFKPTPDEAPSDAMNVSTDMLIEVKLAVDCEFTRYFYIHNRTHGPFNINLFDVISDMENIIEEKIQGNEGFRLSEDKEYCEVAMFNDFGQMEWIEFPSIRSIFDSLVSVRICEINNKIDKK